MLAGLIQNLRLRAEARTGLSSAVAVFALIAAVAGLIAFVFFVFAGFIWLADRYSPLTAALILAGGFVLIAILCALGAVLAQRSNVDRAKRALALRAQSPLFDPAMLGIAMQIGRTIGLRRLAPLAAAGVLVGLLANEWFRDRSAGDEDQES